MESWRAKKKRTYKDREGTELNIHRSWVAEYGHDCDKEGENLNPKIIRLQLVV